MHFKLQVVIDVEEEVSEAIYSSSLEGLGPNGTSSYEVTDIQFSQVGDGYVIDLEVERQEGLHASRDEVITNIIEEMEGLDIITSAEEVLK